MNPKLKLLAKLMLQANEGYRGEKYPDTRGYWTIGFGHNLNASGKELETILLPEAEELFLIGVAFVNRGDLEVMDTHRPDRYLAVVTVREHHLPDIAEILTGESVLNHESRFTATKVERGALHQSVKQTGKIYRLPT